MRFLTVSSEDRLAIVTLERGKVNALNAAYVRELREQFGRLQSDESVDAVLLTGSGSFFSFGFDVPELLTYGKEELVRFLHDFTALYTELFLFPKPLVAAINGLRQGQNIAQRGHIRGLGLRRQRRDAGRHHRPAECRANPA